MFPCDDDDAMLLVVSYASFSFFFDLFFSTSILVSSSSRLLSPHHCKLAATYSSDGCYGTTDEADDDDDIILLFSIIILNNVAVFGVCKLVPGVNMKQRRSTIVQVIETKVHDERINFQQSSNITRIDKPNNMEQHVIGERKTMRHAGGDN